MGLPSGSFAGGWGDGGDFLSEAFGERMSWLFSLNFLGTKLRGTKQTIYDKPRREQELSDAEIARKLQEEELLVSRENVLATLKKLRYPSVINWICKPFAFDCDLDLRSCCCVLMVISASRGCLWSESFCPASRVFFPGLHTWKLNGRSRVILNECFQASEDGL